MTTRTIPEQKVITCDCCSRTLAEHQRRKGGNLKVQRAGLDFQGHAVGSMNYHLQDLCDDCVDTVIATIEDLCATTTEKHKPSPQKD